MLRFPRKSLTRPWHPLALFLRERPQNCSEKLDRGSNCLSQNWECYNDPWPSCSCKSVAQMGAAPWYKLVVYILLSAKRRAYFCKSIAIETGGVSRYFSTVSVSRVGLTLLTKSTPYRRCGDNVQGNVDPRFAAILPLLVPEMQSILRFRNRCFSIFQFSWDFPETFLGNPRKWECSNDPWPWYFCRSIRDTNARRIVILFKRIAVRDRCGPPEKRSWKQSLGAR